MGFQNLSALLFAHIDGTVLALVIIPVSISVMLAVASAFIAGTYGVRRALLQTRRQRAFELSVQWHESVIRSTTTLKHLSNEFRKYADSGATVEEDEDVRDRLIEVAKGIEQSSSDLHDAMLSAILFVDKRTIKQLSSEREKVNVLMVMAREIGNPSGGVLERQLSDWLADLESVIGNIHAALVRGMRKQLDLDPLESEDLEIVPKA